MDIRSAIIRAILKYFLRDCSSIEFSIKSILNKFDYENYWFIRIKIEHEGSEIFGLGCSKSWIEAVFKACGELAEEIARLEQGYETRNGMAAGLSKTSAKNRAIKELVERDAFFYHWNHLIPFTLFDDAPNFPQRDEIVKFKLSSLAIENLTFSTVLIWQPRFEIKEKSVLLFSTATSHNINHSLQKAMEEISWGGPFLTNRYQSPQFHDSIDNLDLCIKGLTNKELLKKWDLLAVTSKTTQAQSQNRPTKHSPNVQYFKTPIRSLIVSKAEHPEAIDLSWKNFGIDKNTVPPHPFW